jgi:hypothetical protein
MNLILLLFPQILVQHIKTILPGLKSRISSALVSVAKEHASYGEITESKVCIYLLYFQFFFLRVSLLLG